MIGVKMDKIRFKVEKLGDFKRVNILINDKDLRKILKTNLEGNVLDKIIPSIILGKCYESYEEDFKGKFPILVCRACGLPVCCSILAKITIKDDKVTWDEIEEWVGTETNKKYDMKFVFNKKQYLKELSKLIEEHSI